MLPSFALPMSALNLPPASLMRLSLLLARVPNPRPTVMTLRRGSEASDNCKACQDERMGVSSFAHASEERTQELIEVTKPACISLVQFLEYIDVLELRVL